MTTTPPSRADNDSDSGVLPVAAAGTIWRQLRHTARGHYKALFAVVVLGILTSALGLVVPATLGTLVDDIAASTLTTANILSAIGVMITATVLAAGGTMFTIILAERVYHRMLACLREQLMDTAMSLPQHRVEAAGTGDLIARTSDDVSQIASAAPQIIPAFTGAGFTVFVTIVGMSALDWRLGIGLLLLLPLYLAIMRWYLRTAPPVFAKQRAAMGVRAQHILESLNGRDTIAGFNLASRRHETVLTASWKVVGPSITSRTVLNMFFTRLQFCEYLGLVIVLSVGFWLISTGNGTLGAATAAMLFLLRLFSPINQLLLVVDVLQSALASLGRMIGVITLSTPVAPTAQTTTVTTPSPPGEDIVRLENVYFTHPGADAPALHDITLTIRAGERIGVVGVSGAGKTTLANLIAGIHRPDTGSVMRPENMAVLAQKAHVFSMSVRDNLALAAEGATDEQILAAVRATGASTVLELLDDGLDTHVGSSGVELTAAQSQLIALARIHLAAPELVVLDEATSEAGSVQAGLLDRAVESVVAGRTSLIIAHRLSQAAACDRILVMDRGRIIEDGTHDALVSAGGAYAGLWLAWSTAQRK